MDSSLNNNKEFERPFFIIEAVSQFYGQDLEEIAEEVFNKYQNVNNHDVNKPEYDGAALDFSCLEVTYFLVQMSKKKEENLYRNPLIDCLNYFENNKDKLNSAYYEYIQKNAVPQDDNDVNENVSVSLSDFVYEYSQKYLKTLRVIEYLEGRYKDNKYIDFYDLLIDGSSEIFGHGLIMTYQDEIKKAEESW